MHLIAKWLTHPQAGPEARTPTSRGGDMGVGRAGAHAHMRVKGLACLQAGLHGGGAGRCTRAHMCKGARMPASGLHGGEAGRCTRTC